MPFKHVLTILTTLALELHLTRAYLNPTLRYINLNSFNLTFPKVNDSVVIPQPVLDRLEKLNVKWDNLNGMMEQAVLWDSGYIFDAESDSFVQFFTKCGKSIDQLTPTIDVLNATCTQPGDIAPCNITNVVQACENTSLPLVMECAIANVTTLGTSAIWMDKIGVAGHPPVARAYRRILTDNLEINIMTFDDLPSPTECNPNYPRAEYIVPCAAYNGDDTEWCSPEPDERVDNFVLVVAEPIQVVDEVIVPAEDSKSKGWIYGVVFGTVAVVGAVAFFVMRKRRAKKAMDAFSLSLLSPSHAEGNLLKAQWATDLDISSTTNIDSNKISIGKQIGAGTSGAVYLATYAGVEVAVKKMLLWKQDQQSEEFKREIQLNTTLKHPNIVQFLGTTVFGDIGLCSVTEYMSRGDLLTVLRDESVELTWSELKQSIAIDSVTGLVYLHRFDPPIMHRDLKSRNILIDKQFTAKLCDFGLSREVSSDTMTLAGSYLWLAPEIFRGEKYTEKADIYSMGVVLSELDTRKLPFHNVTTDDGTPLVAIAVANRVAGESLRVSISPECPADIEKLVMDCTDPNPDNRPTAEQVLERLESRIV